MRRIQPVEQDASQRARGGNLAEQWTVREQDAKPRPRHHGLQPFRRVIGVERQVGGAGLEDAEERDHHVERALDAEPDDGLRAGAERAQMVGELVRADVELAVGQCLVVEHERDGVGVRSACSANSCRDGGVRNGRAVSFHG